MSKQFAVIGNPIEQSRSPELHHAFAAKTGVDLSYTKRLAPLDGFVANIQEFFSNGGSGMNVTVPFKEQAFAQCQVLSERAKIAKAVNTLWMENLPIFGFAPFEIKSAVKSKKLSGNKALISDALPLLDDLDLSEVSLKGMDEHSVDSIAIGYCFLSKNRKGNKK